MGGDDCDELLKYVLSMKHSPTTGLILSLVSSLFLYIYVGMTLVTCLWRTLLLDRHYTKILIGSQRRMMVVLFALSLPFFDISTIYAWRALNGIHSSCTPFPDFLLMWFLINILSVVTMIISWFYIPYSQIMLYLPQVTYTLLMMFYLMMSLARGQICGSTFAVFIPLVLGILCVYFVPIGMRISMERLERRKNVYVGMGIMSGKIERSSSQSPVTQIPYLGEERYSCMDEEELECTPKYVSFVEDHEEEEEEEEKDNNTTRIPFDINKRRFAPTSEKGKERKSFEMYPLSRSSSAINV